jgi:1-deoxyxylulose-5-phosphate synthase
VRRERRRSPLVVGSPGRGEFRIATAPATGRTIDQVRLGRRGLHVSRIGLGMMSFGDPSRQAWALDERAAEPIVRRAVELGVTWVDTADMYAAGASEVVTGRLVRRLLSRDEAVVATKVFYPTTPGPNGRGLSRKHVLAAIDASLDRLGMDYVDLYQIHRWDDHTPIAETMEALHDVVRAGKVRYLGASTMAAWRFAKAQAVAERNGWTRFVSMQARYNLLYRESEREMIPLCLDQGVAVTPYSPLARGVLARSRSRDGERPTARSKADPAQADLYGREGDGEVVDRVTEIAAARDVAPAQVAMAWLLGQPHVTAPIMGATRPSHVEDAVAAAAIELTPDEVARLEAPYAPRWIDDERG